jgi:hypothetical protein
VKATVAAAVALVDLAHQHVGEPQVVDGVAIGGDAFELDGLDVLAGRDAGQQSGQAGIEAQCHLERREHGLAGAAATTCPRRITDVEFEAVDLEPADVVLVGRAAIDPVDQQEVLRSHDILSLRLNARVRPGCGLLPSARFVASTALAT